MPLENAHAPFRHPVTCLLRRLKADPTGSHSPRGASPRTRVRMIRRYENKPAEAAPFAEVVQSANTPILLSKYHNMLEYHN
ncbi:uncharacterized protein B0H18DRAFT_34911 [Fomitopsis serialis]|uniref:uncharacterized protein n=1 Tax=Fomitopsis serialis TaxID=139415 RepID=UPI002007F2AD|nr:uncharacterized protein B0H18DRAFT_34911 [Neoantrodia serialis]KAH9917469.1 hypothetical protein B0H18DRAFT_34911 [Neoantrodia serialis]